MFIRYDGQEWLAAEGTVEQVNIANEMIDHGFIEGDRFELTGRRTLTIDLRVIKGPITRRIEP